MRHFAKVPIWLRSSHASHIQQRYDQRRREDAELITELEQLKAL